MLRITYNYQSPQFYYRRQDALVGFKTFSIWTTTKGAVIIVLKPVILQEL